MDPPARAAEPGFREEDDVMDLTVRESNRWCVVERDEKPGMAKMRRQILREERVVSGFCAVTAPVPARDDTAFKVCGNEKLSESWTPKEIL